MGIECMSDMNWSRETQDQRASLLAYTDELFQLQYIALTILTLHFVLEVQYTMLSFCRDVTLIY